MLSDSPSPLTVSSAMSANISLQTRKSVNFGCFGELLFPLALPCLRCHQLSRTTGNTGKAMSTCQHLKSSQNISIGPSPLTVPSAVCAFCKGQSTSVNCKGQSTSAVLASCSSLRHHLVCAATVLLTFVGNYFFLQQKLKYLQRSYKSHVFSEPDVPGNTQL